MLIKELPGYEKPREKLSLYGPESLSNSELLAILIGTGTRSVSAIGLAQRVLSIDSSGIRYLGECSLEELSAVEGIGKAKACQLLAAAEIGKRMSSAGFDKRMSIGNSEDIAEIFMDKMRYYRKEHFQLLLLNVQGEILSVQDVAVGDLCSTVVHPREIFCQAVKRSAAAVAFVHNHPSGDPTPSRADIDTTKRLVSAGDILGIAVLDHIVIGDGRFVSLRAKGLM